MSINTAGPNIGRLIDATLGDSYYLEFTAFLRAFDGMSQPTVLDKDLNSPPANPSNGDKYIVAANPVGAWVGRDRQIARWYVSQANPAGAWEFFIPNAGWQVAVQDERDTSNVPLTYAYTGALWAVKAIPTVIVNPGAIDGLVISWTSGNAISVSSGVAYIPAVGRLVLSPTAIAVSGLSFAASTWYHVYLWLDGTTPRLDISVTAPDAPYWSTARTKTGFSTHRYIGSVYANASGVMQKFYGNTNRVRVASFDASINRVIGNGQATTPTSLLLTGHVPVTATKIYVKLNNYLTGPATLLQLGPMQTEPQQIILQGSSGVAILQYGDVDVVDRQVWYSYNNAPPSGGGGFIDAMGYEFTR